MLLEEGPPKFENFHGAPDDFVAEPKFENFHRNSMSIMVLVPTGVFFIIGLCYNYLYHILPLFVALVVILCFIMSVVFMLVPRRSPDAPTYWFNIGVLSSVACLSGIGAGYWNYNTNIGFFWAYKGQREYSNVVPDDPALSHLDAGKISFSSDAHIDQTKSLQFGPYCVAPIVGNQQSEEVQYWAGGKGCCETGKSFLCDDADKKEAHAGLVFLTNVRESPLLDYQEAVREAAATYKVKSSEYALVVQWLENPDQVVQAYVGAGSGYFLGSSLLYFISSVIVSMCLHFGQRRPPHKRM